MILIHLKIHRSCCQSPGAQRARLVHVSELSQSVRANEAFKIIVSCLTVMTGQASTGLINLNTAVS